MGLSLKYQTIWKCGKSGCEKARLLGTGFCEEHQPAASGAAEAMSEPKMSESVLREIIAKLREDAHQYASPFYTITPHVETEEREYRAKMLTEIADDIEAALAAVPASGAKEREARLDEAYRAGQSSRLSNIAGVETIRVMSQGEVDQLRKEWGEFCERCGAGIGPNRREGEGTCPRCNFKDSLWRD